MRDKGKGWGVRDKGKGWGVRDKGQGVRGKGRRRDMDKGKKNEG